VCTKVQPYLYQEGFIKTRLQRLLIMVYDSSYHKTKENYMKGFHMQGI